MESFGWVPGEIYQLLLILPSERYNLTDCKITRQKEIGASFYNDANVPRYGVSVDRLKMILALCMLHGIREKDLSIPKQAIPWAFLKLEVKMQGRKTIHEIAIVSTAVKKAIYNELGIHKELANSVVSSNIGVLLKCL